MRWGIVGTGAIASHFAAACGRVAGAEIVAVASRQEQTGQAFLARFGGGVWAASAVELAARDDVDVVYIATPNARHVADALAVIGAGKPVLCEKPLAIDPEGARQVIEAARTAGVFCMEGIWSLCQPAYREVLDRVQSGAIGDLRELHGSFCVPQSPQTMPRLFDASMGGGALLDRGGYLLALAQSFLGDLELRHATVDAGPGGVDLAATLVLESADGRRALLSCAIDRMGANQISLIGTEGRCLFGEPVTSPLGYHLNRRDPKAAFAGVSGRGNPLSRAKDMLKRSPRVRQLRAAFLNGARTVPGGLEYEIAEVEACLAAGATESHLVPLDLSMQIQTLIAATRSGDVTATA